MIATRSALLVGLTLALSPLPALAHQGPPFPIVVDRRIGAYIVSVWTDPDIGTGTFYVILEPVAGESFTAPSAVRVAVAPLSGRLDEVVYSARPERVRRGARYYAEVAFDRGERWRVRIVIESDGGRDELVTDVEATPDGTIGPIGLAIYSFPFVLIAVLWWRVAVARRRPSGRSQPALPD